MFLMVLRIMLISFNERCLGNMQDRVSFCPKQYQGL